MKTRDPRQIALYILNSLEKSGNTLDNLLKEAAEEVNAFSRRDQALLNALVFGVIRWRDRIDWIIKYFSKTRLIKIDPRVLNILRLGLFQIVYLDRIPAAAAVDTSVEMAKSFSPRWVVGFVNALLRNAVTAYESVPFPDSEREPLLALSVKQSFPRWLIKRWLERYGLKEAE